MITIRRSNERGHADHGWLDTYHTFSFAGYHDPDHMGFRRLRVLNQDRVAPGQGFGTHPHSEMEIVTIVVDGVLEHRDSLGNGSIIRPGDVQRMSAGTGVLHSEFNASDTEPVHFIQTWIFPDEKGVEPSYEQKHFDEREYENRLRMIVSGDGAEDSLSINSGSKIFLCRLDSGREIEYTPPPRRHIWLHVIEGDITLTDIGSNATERLTDGDGAAITEQETMKLQGDSTATLLLFELE